MAQGSSIQPHNLVVSRKMFCPVCKKEFLQYAVRKTRIRLVRSDVDLRHYFEPIDPLYYDTILCNSCGYSADVMFFNNIQRFRQPWINEQITPGFKPIVLDLPYTAESVVGLFKHAMKNADAKKAKNGEIGYLHLKMAWLYRDMQDEEKEKEELTIAVSHFEKAYTEEDFPICSMNNMTFRYLVGAIHYLLGNYRESSKWLSEVIVARNIAGRLKNRALDLKDELRKAYNIGTD